MITKDDYYRRKAAKETERNKQAADSWRSKFKDPMVWFTCALAISTFGLVYVAALQYCALEKTDQTLRDTLASNQATQRAVIAISRLQIDPTKNENGQVTHWNFTPFIKNSGNTQALRVKTNGIMSAATGTEIDPFPTVDQWR